MDEADLMRALRAAAPGLAVEFDEGSPEDPHLAERLRFVSFPADRPGTVVYHVQALAALEEAEPGFDPSGLVESSCRLALERREEDERAAEALPGEGKLFEAHARFREGRENPRGWYRQGEALGAGLFVVDLDVFLEVVLRERDFEALRGTTVPLILESDRLALELPGDLDPEEVWSVPGCGLFEVQPGTDLDALEPDEEVPGRFGDLHVIPILL